MFGIAACVCAFLGAIIELAKLDWGRATPVFFILASLFFLALHLLPVLAKVRVRR